MNVMNQYKYARLLGCSLLGRVYEPSFWRSNPCLEHKQLLAVCQQQPSSS